MSRSLIRSLVVSSLLSTAALVTIQSAHGVEAAGGVDRYGNYVKGVTLLNGGVSKPAPGLPTNTAPPAEPPVENLAASYNYPPLPNNQRYHAIWTVTVWARNANGQVQTGTYHVSSHTWGGSGWVDNPSAVAQLHNEVRSLPGRGWYAFDWKWEKYGVCVGN